MNITDQTSIEADQNPSPLPQNRINNIPKILLQIFIYLFLIGMGVFSGVMIDRTYKSKVKDDLCKSKEIDNSTTIKETPAPSCNNIYKNEANNNLTWGKAKLISTITKDFLEKDEGIFSPLLKNKKVVITTYNYKSKNIIHKVIELSDRSYLQIWQYKNPYQFNTGTGSPSIEDFVIATGYENNLNNETTVTHVLNIVNSWCGGYKTQNGINMYFEYSPTITKQKSIGMISLSLYRTYMTDPDSSYPSLISIEYSPDDWIKDEKDPNLEKARVELRKIADTFTFGFEE